jgi:hypothetical protein
MPDAALDARPTARITCPTCGATTEAAMPTDACQFFWDCPACGAVVKPLDGDCCVFCSYADAPCPPVAASGGPCCS